MASTKAVNGVQEAYKNMEEQYPSTYEDVKSYYNEWASTYDIDVKKLNYTLPAETSKFADEVASDQDKRTWTFCDLGAGTGLVGKEMRKRGFQGNFIAVDYSPEMIEKCKESENLYQEHICHSVTKSSPLSLGKESLDIMISTAFSPTMIKIENLESLLETIRPGGYLIMYARTANHTKGYDKRLPAIIEDLQQRKIIQSSSSKPFKLYHWGSEPDECIQACLYRLKKT